MSAAKADVALLWHMHQPYYRDSVTGRSSLPWARLHSVKDYQPMAVILGRYPGVHLTVNFVPSLLKQILEYTEEGLRDIFWEATEIPAADLSGADRIFLLRNFFMANWNLAIRTSPRYGELLEKRGFTPAEKDLERASALFSTQDFLDLQIWFNLIWFHPLHLEDDRDLAEIVRRGRSFTEADKKFVLDKQLALMALVLPAYRGLMERGQIELSCSPFYHPILPLVINVESAREALPDLPMPSPPFARKDDAVLQLERAVAYHTEVFGRRPMGLWPSEGSVSEDMVETVMDSGFSWMASDEEVLYRSLGLDPASRRFNEHQRCDLLYQPYRLQRGGRSLGMVFRDRFLSDVIGFTYGHWEAGPAAADLLGRLESVADLCSDWSIPPLASIILDGENPWEYYREQGYPFLKSLYEGLERSRRLRTAAVEEVLADRPPRKNIPRLFAGSWINHNFSIWIGHPEDRRAWELLSRTRGIIDDLRTSRGENDAVYRKALEEILVAEGSDWCWWYGEENVSGNDEAFDELYRKHLQNVFTLAGMEVPDEYKVTIFTGKRVMIPSVGIFSFINPTIDGRVTSYFEWLSAGEYPLAHRGGAMHRSEELLTGIWFGFNLESLFLRVDPAVRLLEEDLSLYTFGFHFLRPHHTRIEVTPRLEAAPEVRALVTNEELRSVSPEGVRAAVRDVLEVAVPFTLLRARTAERIDFFVALFREGRELGHWPHQGYLSVDVPGPDFEQKIWIV